MPIECYSGWLQDGSFGGPEAEGVNMYGDKGQICTWRAFLGGTQYSNTFPIILSVMCGDGSIPWIWRHCPGRVLEGIGDYIGDEAMRTLIMQYRARMATFDFGGYARGYRDVMEAKFGADLGPEWEPYYIDCERWKATPYQRLRLNDEDGWLAPDELTNPGWSGANIIPIHVSAESDTARVVFRPEDTEERALLCYKTRSGRTYYSQVVRCGEMAIDIQDRPANDVVFCVVANTDYRYTGDEQRAHHWDYRLRLADGCRGIASQHKKWFRNEDTIDDPDFLDLTPVESLRDDAPAERLALVSHYLQRGRDLEVLLADVCPTDVSLTLTSLSGRVEARGTLTPQATYRLPGRLPHGLYFVTLRAEGRSQTIKVVVK